MATNALTPHLPRSPVCSEARGHAGLTGGLISSVASFPRANQRCTRGNNKRAVRTGQYFADGFNSGFIYLANFGEAGKVMDETGVDYAVGFSGATAQAFEVFQVATVNFRTRCDQLLADASERASPSTWWPAPINSCTMAVPMKPVAPVTNTRIIDFFLFIQRWVALAAGFIQICVWFSRILKNM
jgi:hypothetical protein